MRKLDVLSFHPDEDSRLGPVVGWIIKLLVLYSVAMFMVEVSASQAENSQLGSPFWLWNERLVACLFTAEYVARIWTVHGKRRREYIFSGFGLIDLLSVLPFWVGFVLPATPTIYLRLVRTFRILRLLKLVRYMPRVQLLLRALLSCWNELLAVGYLCFVVFLFGSVAVWEVERYAQPDKFSTLGNSMWWMLVTLTTVGYGDVSPVTPLGKAIAAILMTVGIGTVGGFLAIIVSAISHVFNPVAEFPEDLRDIQKTLAAKSRSNGISTKETS